MLKIIGGGLLVFSGAALGLGILRERGRCLALLRTVDRALSFMETEICLCLRPIPDIFRDLDSKEPGGLFQRLSEGGEYLSAGEHWANWAEELPLPPEGRDIISSLSAVLGMCDIERQSTEIKRAREGLHALVVELEAEKKAKMRHYPLLGACMAGIAAILLA